MSWLIALAITAYLVVGLVVALLNLYLDPPSASAIRNDGGVVAGVALALLFLWPIIGLVVGCSKIVLHIASLGRDRQERKEAAERRAIEAEQDRRATGRIDGGFSDED